VPKTLLTKQHQKEKMMQEIALHKTLKHKNVVMFKSSFQDSNFVYITLEICKKQSMMELHKRRGPLTEPEVRYLFALIFSTPRFLKKAVT
jgi:polo-like kinase 1